MFLDPFLYSGVVFASSGDKLLNSSGDSGVVLLVTSIELVGLLVFLDPFLYSGVVFASSGDKLLNSLVC